MTPSQVLDQITQRLYEQTMDAQDGVLYFLLDQMADQHVKELLLAYVLLLKLGPSSSSSLWAPALIFCIHFGRFYDWAGCRQAAFTAAVG